MIALHSTQFRVIGSNVSLCFFTIFWVADLKVVELDGVGVRGCGWGGGLFDFSSFD